MGALPPLIWDLPIPSCFSQDLYVVSKPSLAIAIAFVDFQSRGVVVTSLRSSNNRNNTGYHHASCSKLCLLCMANHVKNLTIIANNLVSGGNALSFKIQFATPTSDIAVAENSNSRNTDSPRLWGLVEWGSKFKISAYLYTVFTNRLILQVSNKIRRALRTRTSLIYTFAPVRHPTSSMISDTYKWT